MKGCIWISHEAVNIHRLLSFERPGGSIVEPTRGIDMSSLLPGSARDQGMMLLDVTYRYPQYDSVDPVILYDRTGKILYTWPEGYIPGWAEVNKVVNQLLEV